MNISWKNQVLEWHFTLEKSDFLPLIVYFPYVFFGKTIKIHECRPGRSRQGPDCREFIR